MVGAGEICTVEPDFDKPGFAEIGIRQVGLIEVGTVKTGLVHVHTGENGARFLVDLLGRIRGGIAVLGGRQAKPAQALLSADPWAAISWMPVSTLMTVSMVSAWILLSVRPPSTTLKRLSQFLKILFAA